ncbi:unnamed protein product [Blepharisma stoltei]|uniref:Uncharacterized protein n=1 Tax=Blepharisma stoltei TaxID=1481888 RepID=A0AAU9K6N4_9CILI|nr:unnamed protein product [Blepharisma stoltei]
MINLNSTTTIQPMNLKEESFTNKRNDMQSLWKFVSAETKKILTSPVTVALYHSKWHKNGKIPALFPGNTMIPECLPEYLCWTWPHDPSKNLISLTDLRYKHSHDAGFFQGSHALEILLKYTSPSSPISPSQTIAFVDDSDYLCILFHDELSCTSWKNSLISLINALETSFTDTEEFNSNSFTLPLFQNFEENYGTVFDISEPSNPIDMWREIKTTFIKADSTTSTEILVYDRTQADLYDSIEEVLKCISPNVDRINYDVIESYLLDVTRMENFNKMKENETLKIFSEKVYSFYDFDRDYNRNLREKYAEINIEQIENEIFRQKEEYEKMKNKDRLGDALNLIFMQKLALGYGTCENGILSKVWALMKNNTEFNKVKRVSIQQLETKPRRESGILYSSEPNGDNFPQLSERKLPGKDKTCNVCDCCII